ncbi:endonuclease/exonuclease/phosphatase family protein [Actinotignum schaalii]|uniref:endonuclease/exonuclease/phosphatase family protein n=1 Tax=Actinotignum schaalii TaxID=59505 RepID=UPI00237DDCFE|nr:endonuclease/exonuclease/phosphatase family protein [Actinotignum schaalii]MDE1655424.1 endonuclease/exonuclease/phosphatase family protein [Actinotignum schaalii]
MRVLNSLLGLLLAVFAVFTVQPAWFGPAARLATVVPGAQIMSSRGALALGMLIAALAVGLLGAVRRCFGGGRVAVSCAVVLLLVALAHAGTLSGRGLERETLGAPAAGELTVVQYNTEGGRVDWDQLADTIVRVGADAVSLIETSGDAGAEIQEKLAARGVDYQLFDGGVSRYNADWRSSVLLVSAARGEYEAVDLSESYGDDLARAVAAAPRDGARPDAPMFVAGHPTAPVPAYMDLWRAEARALYQVCAAVPDAVVAGDFNSTADHQAALSPSSTCRDLGADAGIGAVGTWPTTVPALLASPIDRVMSSGAYRGVAGEIIDPGNASDHRGIIVRLKPAAAPATDPTPATESDS